MYDFTNDGAEFSGELFMTSAEQFLIVKSQPRKRKRRRDFMAQKRFDDAVMIYTVALTFGILFGLSVALQ